MVHYYYKRIFAVKQCQHHQEPTVNVSPFLYVFAHSGVQHILCCVFVLFFFVFVPYVSLDCPFLIALSVFSNVYLD